MSAIEKTLRWLVIIGIFALPFVPLLVTTSLFFPYITGKNFAFRAIVEVMAGAWLALALYSSAYRPRRSWLLAALAAFVLIIGVADVFGVHPFKSIWSNYERMDGWITLIHLFAYVVVAASVLNTEKLWRRLFWTSLGVSVYLGIYGILQVAGISALGQGGASGLTARIDATFGNPIYFAVYMLFHVFIAALLWAQQWSERGEGKRLSISLAYGAIILLDTFALFFTGTRGAMVGLIGGTLLSALLMLICARNSRTAWRTSVSAVVALIVLIGGFWMIRDAAWVQRVGFLQRLATISTSDNTVKARFINWSIAWEGVKERPVLGWGQENYAIVFDKYYDPRMYGQEPWFDRVHNIVFDWLIAGGFLGLIAYLSIFACALWCIWRRSAFTAAERSIFTGLLAAYFVHNFFVFDNVTSYILFGTVLAYIMWRAGTADKAAALWQTDVVSRSALPYAAVVAALLVWGVAWGVNQNALAANRVLLSSLAPRSEGILKNLALFKESIAYHSYGTQEAREQLAQAAAQVARLSVPNDVKQQFYDVSTAEMKLQAEESPLDARFPLFLGVIYDAYGDSANAAVALEKAHQLSPKKQTILFQQGENALAKGDVNAAIGFYKSAYELAPQVNDARLSYAAILIRAGHDAEAENILQPLVVTGAAADPRILSAYVARKAYGRAIPIWVARIQAQPQDSQAYFTLAAIYYEMGNKQAAIGTLEEAKKAIPAIAGQAEGLIQEIRAGTAKLQ